MLPWAGVIFVDYLGPAERLEQVREIVPREVGQAMRVPPSQVVVRRLVTEDEGDTVELWIELSSDEQLYRLGQKIAQQISGALRDEHGPEQVWVMYRVVPLSHAFLNGDPRGRGTPTFD
jgi:hypothetical protein